MPVHSVPRADVVARIATIEAAGETIVQVIDKGDDLLIFTSRAALIEYRTFGSTR